MRDKVAEAAQGPTGQGAFLTAPWRSRHGQGEANLTSQGIVDQTPVITRNGSIPDAPQAVVDAGFTMQPGEVRVVEEGDFIAVLQLNSVTPAAETGPDAEALKAAIAAQVQQALAGDLFAAYSDALISATPVCWIPNAHLGGELGPAMMLEPSFEVFQFGLGPGREPDRSRAGGRSGHAGQPDAEAGRGAVRHLHAGIGDRGEIRGRYSSAWPT